jgi:hypothetical protein
MAIYARVPQVCFGWRNLINFGGRSIQYDIRDRKIRLLFWGFDLH